MLDIILISNSISFILLIWFKSEAILEWGTLFRLSKLLKEEEFKKQKINQIPLEITYPMFLRINYNCFITKMISCPLCLSTWLSIIFILLSSISILFIPIVCILSLILYGTVSILLKNS